VPDHKVAQAVLALMGQPLIASTLILPGQTEALNDAGEIRDALQKHIQAVVDAGACHQEPTTVIDLSQGGAEVIRQGRGDVSALGLG